MISLLKSYYLRQRFWINDYLHGDNVGRIYRDIAYFDTHSPEQCLQKQQKALNHILQHAVSHSAYYQSIVQHDAPKVELTDFPVLKKKDLRENFDAILVDAQYVKGQGSIPYDSRHTSGSSGIPFVMKFSHEKMLHRMAALKYFGAREGFKSHERLLNVHSLQLTPEEFAKSDLRMKVKEDKAHNILSLYIMGLDTTTIDYMYRLLITDKSVALRAHVSTVAALAKHVHDNRLTPPRYLKIISCTGEVLPDHIRQQIKDSLRCEVTSMYAMEEFGLLAVDIVPTKESGNQKRMNNADYYFEVLKLDSDVPASFGEPGRLIITDLRNEAFPIIRYDNGDIVVMQEGTEASSYWPVISEIRGRVLDIIYSTDGKGITPNIITKSFQYIHYTGRWQFVQESETEYTIYIDKASVCDKDGLTHYFLSILGIKAKIYIVEVEEIPTMPSGKTKLIINKSKHNV